MCAREFEITLPPDTVCLGVVEFPAWPELLLIETSDGLIVLDTDGDAAPRVLAGAVGGLRLLSAIVEMRRAA